MVCSKFKMLSIFNSFRYFIVHLSFKFMNNISSKKVSFLVPVLLNCRMYIHPNKQQIHDPLILKPFHHPRATLASSYHSLPSETSIHEFIFSFLLLTCILTVQFPNHLSPWPMHNPILNILQTMRMGEIYINSAVSLQCRKCHGVQRDKLLLSALITRISCPFFFSFNCLWHQFL